MAKGKNVLTTGDVAKICNVAPRTVSKWFDSGELKGYRIPGSKDRRIPVNELIKFMKRHDMPVTELIGGKTRVLIVDSDMESASKMAENLKEKADYEVEIVNSTFKCGSAAEKFSPHVMLINLFGNGIDASEIVEHIRSDEELETIKLLAVANQLGDAEAAALMRKGFDGYISEPEDIAKVIKEIESSIAIVY